MTQLRASTLVRKGSANPIRNQLLNQRSAALIVPGPSALKARPGFWIDGAGRTERASLHCCIDQSLNLRPAVPHVAAPVLVIQPWL